MVDNRRTEIFLKSDVDASNVIVEAKTTNDVEFQFCFGEVCATKKEHSIEGAIIKDKLNDLQIHAGSATTPLETVLTCKVFIKAYYKGKESEAITLNLIMSNDPEVLAGIDDVEADNNGTITSADRTKIGKGTPDWSFGATFNAEWKGFDLSVFMQGVSGVDVFDATYRQDIASGNFPTWVLSRWTGEGTSNRVPILKQGDSKNWVVSDLYIQDGSYLRLKNLTLGYTLPRNLTQKIGISRLRVYAMAENLFTWTKYWGFDPEIGTSGTSLGVDYGVYPQARTYTIGVNLNF